MESLAYFGITYTQLHGLGVVALAMVLGGVIGMERELADKPAGLRTHMLVAGAAALFLALGDVMVERFAANTQESFVNTDPIRILEAVVAGVAFLGAGTIMRRDNKQHVEGLTTAASLLLTAAVGISVALSQYFLAISVTILVVLVAYSGAFMKSWLPQGDGKREAEL